MSSFEERLIDIKIVNFETKIAIKSDEDIIYLVYIKKCLEHGLIFNPNLTEEDFQDKVFEVIPFELKYFKKGFKNSNKIKDAKFFMDGFISDIINCEDEFKKYLLKLLIKFKKLNEYSRLENRMYIEDISRIESIIERYEAYFSKSRETIKEEKSIENNSIIEEEEVESLLMNFKKD